MILVCLLIFQFHTLLYFTLCFMYPVIISFDFFPHFSLNLNINCHQKMNMYSKHFNAQLEPVVINHGLSSTGIRIRYIVELTLLTK